MRLIVEGVLTGTKPIESEVDENLERFDLWFQGLDNEALSRSERAILKTYLVWVIQGSPNASGSNPGSPSR